MEKPMAERGSRERRSAELTPHVTLDASEVEDRTDQALRVALVEGAEIRSDVVRLSKAGTVTATFRLSRRPDMLTVLVGPEDASDEELAGLQTIRVDVPAQQWQAGPELRLPPIRISAYHWHWWLRWCRWFVIRGHVICPDGHPVPGATVCAFDSDWWWWWWSKQKVGCATTDANGALAIKFRWCCGWWPWWWWRHLCGAKTPSRSQPAALAVRWLRLGCGIS
jgi:hypothetical protein